MVTVRFRVRLGLGSRVRVKVRLPFAFVILRDRSIALRDRAKSVKRAQHYRWESKKTIRKTSLSSKRITTGTSELTLEVC